MGSGELAICAIICGCICMLGGCLTCSLTCAGGSGSYGPEGVPEAEGRVRDAQRSGAVSWRRFLSRSA